MRELIEKCYDNRFQIDLKKIHIEISSQRNDVKKLSFEDANFNKNKLVFDDQISSVFKLITNDGLNYLLGDKSCYPCGNIVEGAYDINWVPILVLPTGQEIITSSDIRKTCCVNMDPIHLYIKNLNPCFVQPFITDYEQSFQSNDWYTPDTIRHLITSFDQLSIDNIFNELRKRFLLNPFELALGSIVYDFSLLQAEVLGCINYARRLKPRFSYLKYLRDNTLSIAGSTAKIISSSDFESLINSFTINEIESFFEVDFLIDSINFGAFYDDLMGDVLQVNVYKRLCQDSLYVNPTNLLNERLLPVNITEDIIKTFYHRLKMNIRDLENKMRAKKGYNDVGSVYNEILLYEAIKSKYDMYDVIPQYSPEWLGRQRFDIFIKNLNIAIEYNGQQHYHAISFFGGEEGFLQTLKRDQQKRQKCQENGCHLFEIKYNEDLNQAISTLRKDIDYIIANKTKN